MTSQWKWARACALATLVVLYASAALAQATSEADSHRNHREMMTRMAALDARIDMMVADMNMFTGDLKTAAIASLLTALVERDKAMRDALMKRHDQMMGQLTAAHEPAGAGEEKPAMKCGMMKPKADAPDP